MIYKRKGFNPYLSSGLFHPYQLDESISIIRGGWCTFSFLDKISHFG